MNTIAVKSALTKLKELNKFPKAKRNDVVVVEVKHSSTDVKLKTTTYYTYFLAKAVKVARDGKVVEFIRPHWGRPEMVTVRNRIFVITGDDKQGAAREIYATELGAMDFDDAEQIKAAIIDKVEALS